MGEASKQAIALDVVLVAGCLGGRFDHAMSNVGMLYRHMDCPTRLLLLSPESVVALLPPGQHTLHIDTSIEVGRPSRSQRVRWWGRALAASRRARRARRSGCSPWEASAAP